MQQRPAGSKSRPSARKRVNADDSPFIGPSGSHKRSGDKTDGVERTKRKRVEAQASGSSSLTKRLDGGESTSLTIDFLAFPLDALHRYLLHADAVPALCPSPCSVETPPLPSSLLNAQAMGPRTGSPMSSMTPANRPKRDGSYRRRSSRLQEEDARSRRAPILADAEAVHDVFATLVERHFEKQSIREGEAVQQFLSTVQTRC